MKDPIPMTDPAAPERLRGGARTVVTGDGLAWLRASELGPAHAIVTSLPDVSEMASMGFHAWRAWFVDAAALVCASLDDLGIAVFYQTDIRRDGRWVDKGHLVTLGAERAGAHCLDHKIVCRVPAGTTTRGRPGYAHLLAFSRGLFGVPDPTAADVLPALGQMSWTKAMGTDACESVCRFLLRSPPCRVVVDPFCGHGTMLAVANAYGFDAVGVELSPRRASRARNLRFVLGHGLA